MARCQRLALARFHQPPFKPCLRFSRTRLNDDLLDVACVASNALPFTGVSGRVVLPSPDLAECEPTWHTPIAGQRSCRAFTLRWLAVSGMPSRLPPRRHDQSKAPSLQRVLLHAFLGTTDPSDFLLAPRDFSHPTLYARSLPDLAAR